MVKLSVVVPVYNVEKYVARCLDSVTAYGGGIMDAGGDAGYEVIVVNDGSTDSSGKIAEEYAARYPGLVRVINTPNAGVCRARNLAIEKAQGEYLYCIDSDDYLIDGGMEEILQATKRGCDIWIFDAVSVREDGSEIRYIKGCALDEHITLDEYPGLILEIPNVWNKLIRRSLFTDNGISFPDIWFEDLVAVLKLYPFARSVEYSPRPLYRYVQRPNSITNCKNTRRNLEIITAVDEVIAFYKSRGEYERLYRELEYLAFYCQFLTASVRVNLAEWNTPVQDELIDDYIKKFPTYLDNPYIAKMPTLHKLLMVLFAKKKYALIHFLMKTNNILKRKNLY